MTKISKPLGVEKTQTYYLEEFKAADQTYYTEGNQRVGQWHGLLAEQFGLRGSVDANHYNRLALGQHPHTGEQLIRHQTISDRQKWTQNGIAWREHLESLFCESREWFRESEGRCSRQHLLHSEVRGVEADHPLTERETKLIEMHALAAEMYRENLTAPESEQVRGYLGARNVSTESVERFGIGVANGNPDQLVRKLSGYGPELMEASGLFRRDKTGQFHDRFKDRLMFPISNAAGDIVAFGGRKLDEQAFGPKYLNSPLTEIYSKSRTLYNAHLAQPAATERNRVVVVEGYLDAIAAVQAGIPNVVAACGTALEGETLRNLSENVVLNLDGDAAGRKAAHQHAEKLLAAGFSVRIADMRGYDPDEYIEDHGAEAYRRQVEKPRPLIEWLMGKAQEEFDVNSIEGKIDAAHSVIETLEKAASPELRAALGREAASYLNVEVEKVDAPTHSEHIAAWDATISPHKSYSVTALVGGDTGLINDHNAAITVALDAGQEYTQARMGNNNAPLTTGNWVCARFVHDTARPVGDRAPNPHLHTHCLLFNMTDAEGQVRAVNAQEWFKTQTYMDAVFHAESAYRARKRGYELEHGRNFSTRIKGYTDEYLALVSARTEAIEKEKLALGLRGAEADERVNKRLRQDKVQWDEKALREEHRRQAAEYGNAPEQVVADARNRLGYELSEERRRRVAHEALDYAKSRLFEGQAVVDRFEIFRDALRYGVGHIRLDDVQAAFSERLAQRQAEFVSVDHYRVGCAGERYSTDEVRRVEWEVMVRALERKGSAEPILDKEKVSRDEYRERYKERLVDGRKITLNNGQMWMSWKVLTSPDQYQIVHGLAGVGKSTAMTPIAELARQAGYDVMGLAPTGGAANSLSEAGISCRTIQAHNVSWFREEVPDKRLYIVDEGSLAGNQTVHEFQRSVRPCDRVVFVYDAHQHQAVEAGRIVEALEQSGVTTHHMKQIVRQRNTPELIPVVKALANHEVLPALKMLDDQGRILEYSSRAERFQAMANMYFAHRETTRIVCPDNRSLLELDGVIRQVLFDQGVLSADLYQGSILSGVRDIREADRKVAARYEVGDVVRFGKDVEALGVRSGDYVSVTAVNPDRNLLTIEVRSKLGSRLVTYNPRDAYGVEIFATEQRKFAMGERVQITRPWKVSRGVKIANRATGTIRALDADGNCTLEMDGVEGKRNRYVKLNLREMPHLDYAYAMTSYSQQFSTSDIVLVHIDTGDSTIRSIVDKALAYVGLTRGANEMLVFTDDKVTLLSPESPVNRIAIKPKAHSVDEIHSVGVKVA